MTEFHSTVGPTESPTWTKRNKKIASLLTSRPKVLDLGCGSKDLLNYIQPKEYLGVDYQQPLADVNINFNDSFKCPKPNKGKWSYIVCSGLLEYLIDLNLFFNTIQHNSKSYVFTYWLDAQTSTTNANKNMLSISKVLDLINQNFQIQKVDNFRRHLIFVCKDNEI